MAIVASNVSCYVAVMSGIASSFGGNQNISRILGMGYSGLITNIIAFVCTFFSKTISISYQFLIYLIFGDIFIFYYYYKKVQFFHLVRNEEQFLVNNNKNLEIELIQKNKETGSHGTLSVFENILECWSQYLHILINYITTIACFPSLIYTFDLSSVISFRFKFILIAFIYNIGDILGRYLHDILLISKTSIIILNIFKTWLVYICYLISRKKYEILSSLSIKICIIFIFAFINGYIPCVCFTYAQRKFPGKAKDLKVVGQLYQWTIEIGLLLGGVTSYLLF